MTSLVVVAVVGTLVGTAWFAHREAEWQWARRVMRTHVPPHASVDVADLVDREFPDATPRRRRLLIEAGRARVEWGMFG